MLPGFRLLLATTVLAISVLVFGLGAAALLRAAHEEFVSLPSWRLAQQPVLTPFTPQVPRLETTPILAMLRIEAPSTKPLPETLRRDVSPTEAARQQPAANLPVTSLPVTSLPAPIDAPDAKPIEVAARDSGIAVTETEQASAPEQTAPLNAQASIDVAVRTDAPVEAANTPVAKTLLATAPDIATPDSKRLEIKAVDGAPAETSATEVKSAELKSPDVRPVSRKASDTEASEPISTETVASIERSTEATAFAVEPQPVVKKAKRPNARALARRRQIARARAEARVRAEQLRQQQNAFPLFGG
ncbi:hypothetical protein BH10PSE11_BH10PSE11_15950 [soil metagenome]